MPRSLSETPTVTSCVEHLTSWGPRAALIRLERSTDPVSCPA